MALYRPRGRRDNYYAYYVNSQVTLVMSVLAFLPGTHLLVPTLLVRLLQVVEARA
jgi:hypothetical protein